MLAGQWVGRFEGEASGIITLDLDDEGQICSGHASIFDLNSETAGLLVSVAMDSNLSDQDIVSHRVDLMHPNEARTISIQEAHQVEPDTRFPTKIHINVRHHYSSMRIRWSSDVGTSGEARLTRLDGGRSSPLKPSSDITNWNEFKDYVFSLNPREYVFRGQDCSKRLRTSFHRSRRKSLVRYVVNDIPQTHHSLTSRTHHIFDLGKPVEVGAFLNMLQHHGYPTPLLDWSYSPFVAAFFAYRFQRTRLVGDDKVRLFVFNKEKWTRYYAQLQGIAFCRPHLSILEALTIENQRAMPQQALSTLTNIDDIETYVRHMETVTGERFLEAIDLPANLRKRVMDELSIMGITAGTLFPGLDGTCEELRGRYFNPLS